MAGPLVTLLRQSSRSARIALRPSDWPRLSELVPPWTEQPTGLCTIDARPGDGILLLDSGTGPDPRLPLWPVRVKSTQMRFWIPPDAQRLYWVGAEAPDTGEHEASLRMSVEAGSTSLLYYLSQRLLGWRAAQIARLLTQARATRRPRFLPAPSVGREGDLFIGDDAGVWGIIDFGRAGAPTGLCRVRLQLDVDEGHVDAALYFDDGHGFRPARMLSIVGAAGNLIQLDCFIPVATRRIRADLLQHHGRVRLNQITITPAGLRATVRRAFAARLQRSMPSLLWRLPPPWRRRILRELDAETVPASLQYARYVELGEPRLDLERAAIERHQAGFSQRPRISVVMPTFNTPPVWLRKAIASVRAQLWSDWELCIADDASTDATVRALLREEAGRDSRIRLVECKSNAGISAASNAAMALATGEWVCFLDHDDELHPLALYFVVASLQQGPDVDLIYTDEDKIDEQGIRFDPHFKPDWDPELLQSINYIAHLAVYRRSVVTALGGLRSDCDGSQDFDLALRVARAAGAARIRHIPLPLYHWRAIAGSTARALDEKSYPHQAGIRALTRDLAGTGAAVGDGAFPTSYRVDWPVPDPAPLVSLLVPTRDGVDHLRLCVDSLFERTEYPNYELIVIDNQSRDPATLAYFDALRQRPRVRLIGYDAPFNYSAINNFAAQHALGTVLVLLNDDTEVRNGGWLRELVSLAVRTDVGAVGAKLYYPDGSIQHAGVALGIGGVAGHLHLHAPGQSSGYLGRLKLRQTVGAVTGACLAVERRKFDAVGGLDERELQVAFNDIDLCLKLAAQGWRTVWTPWAELVHHESKSRGPDTAPDKVARFNREIDTMKRRWGPELRRNAYFSPHFSRRRHDYGLAEQPYGLRPWSLQSDGSAST